MTTHSDYLLDRHEDGTVIVRGSSYPAERDAAGTVFYWSHKVLRGGYRHRAGRAVAATFRPRKRAAR